MSLSKKILTPINADYKTIWLISYPIILGSIAENIVSVTDTAFLGHVGKIALGASAIASLFYMSCVMLLWGISIGSQIMIARRFGEKKFNQIGKTTEHSLYFQIFLAIILFVFMQLFGSQVLKHIVKSEEILSESITFIQYRAWGIFFTGTNLIFRAFYIGINKTKIISISTIFMAVINIFLDYVLIFGNWGFPQLGIKGAAIASVIAEITTTLIFILYTIRKISFEKYILFRWTKLNLNLLNRLFKLSFPIMLQFYISVCAWFAFFLLVEKMGETELAVSNIIRSTFLFLMLPIWGFAAAANTLTSQLIGRNETHRVLPIVYKSVKLNLLLVCVIILIGLIFPKSIISLYTNDLELINTSIQVFYTICIGALIAPITFTFFQAVAGTGNTLVALIIEILTIIIYLIYAFWTIQYLKFPIHWVWSAEIVYFILLGSLSFCYLRYGNWKNTTV